MVYAKLFCFSDLFNFTDSISPISKHEIPKFMETQYLK